MSIVYSTEHGNICPECGKPVNRCICKNPMDIFTGDGIVRISRSTKGRRGKLVTVINGLPFSQNQLRQLGKELRQKCGTGGTVKNRSIELQGDHRDFLVSELQNRGFTVKKAGG